MLRVKTSESYQPDTNDSEEPGWARYRYRYREPGWVRVQVYGARLAQSGYH